jgi:hypothetical protein
MAKHTLDISICAGIDFGECVVAHCVDFVRFGMAGRRVTPVIFHWDASGSANVRMAAEGKRKVPAQKDSSRICQVHASHLCHRHLYHMRIRYSKGFLRMDLRINTR